jgi:hypothetical protein
MIAYSALPHRPIYLQKTLYGIHRHKKAIFGACHFFVSMTASAICSNWQDCGNPNCGWDLPPKHSPIQAAANALCIPMAGRSGPIPGHLLRKPLPHKGIHLFKRREIEAPPRANSSRRQLRNSFSPVVA